MRRILLSILLTSFVLGCFSFAAAQAPDSGWLPATPEKLPRWRGFNLLNKFMAANVTPFDEADFRMIHGWGFNFVRIPMDYRIWIVKGDWTKIDEKAAFADLDQAVAWGEKYHVHISLNFHRAPGYCVNPPQEARSLWTDPEAQRVCALHWAAFARHFKGIPNERLSFDLVNEAGNVDPQTYAKVVALLAAAIRAEDPGRLIIAEGLQWGNQPVRELVPLNIAQSMHDYTPMELTHYHASWIPGSSDWAVPEWPLFKGVPGFVYGPGKPDLQAPLTIKHSSDDVFPAGTHLELKVGTVSVRGRLVVRADGQVVFDKTFVSGPESKEGEKVVYKPEWKIYQNIFAQTETVTLTSSAKQITISNDDGDWMTLDSLTLQAPMPERGEGIYPPFTLRFSNEYGKKHVAPLIYQPDVSTEPWAGGGGEWVNRSWLYDHQIVAWRRLDTVAQITRHHGVGIMVGEFGCFNQTPDDVTLRWMEDTLTEFKTMDWGWALWNLKGPFGILDSNRPGAVYQDFEGHKLDVRMLRLLQEN
ncbi:MAG TPA: cellulase family glycosylhydrolase [Candidatus Methylacidiphilales bacterium]|nr:cellulase family glycosylhydrolase [Candidatus Methylacidiphilales bacterium]